MSIRRRAWTTRTGQQKEAWIVDYLDGQGIRRLKTFARKKEADGWTEGTVHARPDTTIAIAHQRTINRCPGLLAVPRPSR
jgi:integrase